MRLSVACLALGAALVAAAVDELAEQFRSRRICRAAYGAAGVTGKGRGDALCRADTRRQRGNLPGLGQLTGCDTLIQVAVTVVARHGGRSGLGHMSAAV